MFAVIRTGGKQYKVASGDVIDVEKLAGNAGDKVEIADVLMAGDKIGSEKTPLKGAKVIAEIVEQFRDEKVIILRSAAAIITAVKKGTGSI